MRADAGGFLGSRWMISGSGMGRVALLETDSEMCGKCYAILILDLQIECGKPTITTF